MRRASHAVLAMAVSATISCFAQSPGALDAAVQEAAQKYRGDVNPSPAVPLSAAASRVESLQPNPCASLEGPPEKKVRAASVIALARFEKSGTTLRCVITEILKEAPNTAFSYRVGDEFRHGNIQIKDNTDYGDGEILFFVGSPAEHCYSVAFSGERLRSMGEMPITQLRDMIR
jgi:hypothetical protein